MRRRSLLLAAAAMNLIACSEGSATQSNPVWVRLSGEGDGFAIRVDQESVQLVDLDDVVLAHALASNPELSAQEARSSVRVYLVGEPNVPLNASPEVLRALSGFEKLAVVAEDRRS